MGLAHIVLEPGVSRAIGKMDDTVLILIPIDPGHGPIGQAKEERQKDDYTGQAHNPAGPTLPGPWLRSSVIRFAVWVHVLETLYVITRYEIW
jgi:hypothetical protein